jgi:hypothetical protein
MKVTKETKVTKVFCNGFWTGFFEKIDPINITFFFNLLADVYNEEPVLTHNIDEAEILMESVFTDITYVNHKPWRASFLYTGESYYARCMYNTLPSYSCILGFNYTERNFVELPLYLLYLKSIPDMDLSPAKTIPNNYTTAVISNGSANERVVFLDRLEKRLPVLYGGSYKNNIGGKLTGCYATDNLTAFYKNSKFAITMENTKIGHYITEKIINGFKAGVVPIYWGSQHVTEHFNSKRFIILEDTKEETINRVIDMMASMSDEEYLEMVNEPIFNKDMSIDTIYNKAVENIKRLVL